MVYLSYISRNRTLSQKSRHTYSVKASLCAQLLDAEFEAARRKVTRGGDVYVVLEVIGVVFLGWSCQLFAGLVVPMASSPQVKWDTGTQFSTSYLIAKWISLLSKMTSENFDFRKPVEDT